MSTITRIQYRRGFAAEWVTANPTLLSGEMGIETDTRRFKIGDGVTAWNSLLYPSAGTPAWGDLIGTIADQADLQAALDAKMPVSYLDNDPALMANSASKVPSQQAVLAFVLQKIADLVNSSPSALDTLKELADALGDDANFSSTMSAALGNRLRVDTAAQGLSGTQQSNARTNLSLGDSATKNVGTVAGSVASGDDSRLTDARTPTAHKSSHAAAGSDALAPSDIGAIPSGGLKTINSTNLEGSGDIAISASPGGSDGQLQVNVSGSFAGAPFWREDANTVAQRNGVTSQTLQVYNTYTNASNYERVSMRWSSNVALIGTQNAGTGSARELYLSNASGNVGLAVSNSGFLKFVDGAVERFTMGESSGVYIGTSTSRTMRFQGGQFNAGNFTLMVGDAVTSLSARSHTIRTADRQEFNGDYGTGPTLNIRAGNAAQNAGSGNYDGGSLYIDGGAKAGSGNDGDIYVGNTRGKLRVIQEALFSKVMTPAQYTNATEPSYVNGQMFFNTDLDKLRIGGATGWETVTST